MKKIKDANRIWLKMIAKIYESTVSFDLTRTEDLRLQGIKNDVVANKKISNKQANEISRLWRKIGG